MHTTMQLQPSLSPISLEPEAAVIPSVEQMIESFQGMDFGQYDHLGERMFLEQESQPGGSSTAHQFPHGPPHFTPHTTTILDFARHLKKASEACTKNECLC